MRACECGKTLGRKNVTGLCKSCFTRRQNADPAFQERRLKAIADKWAEPGYRAKMREVTREVGIKAGQNPFITAQRRKLGHQTWERLFTPEVRAKTLKAVSERAGKTLRARWMAWCPEEYWPEYRRLMKIKKLPMVEARAIIFDLMRVERERKAKRPADHLSPFERQERALERGGKLVANDARPSGNQVVRRVG